MKQTKPFDGQAKWIWSGEGIGARPSDNHDHYRVRFFRRSFSGVSDGARLIAHVSADSRYVLWLNGNLVDRGPARGDIAHHFYETYDLTAHLRPEAENVLAALVIYCGDVMPTYFSTGAPCGLMTAAPGFIMDAALTDESEGTVETLHTDERWKVLADVGAYHHEHCEAQGNYRGTYVGYTERFNGAFYPWGWQSAGFDSGGIEASGFEAATVIFPGVRPDNVRDSFMPHRLLPRPIPQMESRIQQFERAVPANDDWAKLLSGAGVLQVPAHTQYQTMLVMPALTTAFPRLSWSGGQGTRIRLSYAEALTQNGERLRGERLRGGEDTGDMVGVFDEIVCGGGAECWESWHFRTFRYVKVAVETAEEALDLEVLESDFWAYPFELKAGFECDDSFYSTLLEVGFRTLRLCSHETYEDCPYYEQLSYAGDNYVTAQVAALLSGDFRLTAHTIREFYWSINSEGLTMSRYPCRMPQVIPGWSQFWLLTVGLHYQATGDLVLVNEVLDGVESVLRWFERKREDGGNGLVGKLNYWCVLDWSPDWRDDPDAIGVPPGAYAEATAAYNFLHIWCLHSAADLFAATGREERAECLRRNGDALSELAHQTFWNAERQAYQDRRSAPGFSQLTNALAILSEAAPRECWSHLVGKLLDPSLCRAAFFGQHFIAEALAKAEEFAAFWPVFEVYRELIEEQGLTTIPENPGSPRSLCHAWSTGCVYHLLAHGLGVRPLEPGWRTILIAPQPGPHSWLRGHAPTPHGTVSVEVRRNDGKWILSASTPAGIPVTVRLPGQKECHFLQGGQVEIGNA